MGTSFVLESKFLKKIAKGVCCFHAAKNLAIWVDRCTISGRGISFKPFIKFLPFHIIMTSNDSGYLDDMGNSGNSDDLGDSSNSENLGKSVNSDDLGNSGRNDLGNSGGKKNSGSSDNRDNSPV